MKVLLDSCVSDLLIKELGSVGHDVTWTGSWSYDPGDIKILEQAYNEGRTLITFDNDFGELAVLRKMPHFGIVRLVNLLPKQQASVCLKVLAQYEAELQAGAIVTAELNRIRIRPADKG